MYLYNSKCSIINIHVTVVCKKISAASVVMHRKKDDYLIGDLWWFSDFLFPSLFETFQRDSWCRETSETEIHVQIAGAETTRITLTFDKLHCILFLPMFLLFPTSTIKPVFWRNRLLAFRVMPIFFSTTYSRLITENPLTSIICRVWSRTSRHQRIPSHHYHRLPQDPGMRGGKGLQNFIPHQLAHIGGGFAMEPLDWVHCRAYWQSLPYPQTISNIQTTLNGMIHIGYTKKIKKTHQQKSKECQ